MNALYVNSVAGSAYVREKWGRPCSPNLFAKLACKGAGPRYVKIGRFRAYTTAWLDEWVTAQIVGPLNSTSETAARSRGRKPNRQTAAAAAVGEAL